MGGKKEMRDPALRLIEHGGDPEFSLVTRSSDGQMLFLVNMLSKMKQGDEARQPHRRSAQRQLALYRLGGAGGRATSAAGSSRSDWLEAIVALPLNMFYNTGIATYVWVLTNRKPEHRRGKVQLIDATKWSRPLRKNLGKKNCELGEEEIERICRTFLDFEESEESRILDNRSFGHWKVTVDRPLRLAVDLSVESKGAVRWRRVGSAGDAALAEAVGAVAERMGAGPHRDLGAVEEAVKRELKRLGGRATLTMKRKRLLRRQLTGRDEAAEPVIGKVLRRDVAADPIRGRFTVGEGRRARVVEYERDPELRDTEQIPLLEEGGIEAFLRREVLPWAADAWYDERSVKVGYEISFNRVFYKPKPMRTLEEITADILATERESEGLLEQITAGLVPREPREHS